MGFRGDGGIPMGALHVAERGRGPYFRGEMLRQEGIS